MRVGLIASGTFISDGLSAELGMLPPSLVPLGNRHLLFHQYHSIRHLVDKLFVSLPEGFDLQLNDKRWIEDLDIEIIYSDPSLKIGDALANSINYIGLYEHDLLILYGDTIISGLDAFPPNAVSIHKKRNEYRWADLSEVFGLRGDQNSELTLSGIFSFSNVSNLLRSIVRAKGDFVDALSLYDETFELQFVSSGTWYDFGHVQTYFQSTGIKTTQRSFNTIQINKRDVVKTSENRRKIKAEALWFKEIPEHMKIFTPAFLGDLEVDGKSGYRIENSYLSTLSNLAVFGNLSPRIWSDIFSACLDFVIECRKVTPRTSLVLNPDSYFGNKTSARLKEFSSSQVGAQLLSCNFMDGRPIPTISEILDVTNTIIRQTDHGSECMLHGDFCFSNIFYNFRSNSVKVIDPRGELPNGASSIFGLQSYDIAKFAHSIVGGYDLIISNYVQARIVGNTITTDFTFMESKRWKQLLEIFSGSEFASTYGVQQVSAMVIHLLLSMLPLHSDRPDRQAAMLSMAYKIHKTITD